MSGSKRCNTITYYRLQTIHFHFLFRLNNDFFLLKCGVLWNLFYFFRCDIFVYIFFNYGYSFNRYINSTTWVGIEETKTKFSIFS